MIGQGNEPHVHYSDEYYCLHWKTYLPCTCMYVCMYATEENK